MHAGREEKKETEQQNKADMAARLTCRYGKYQVPRYGREVHTYMCVGWGLGFLSSRTNLLFSCQGLQSLLGCHCSESLSLPRLRLGCEVALGR